MLAALALEDGQTENFTPSVDRLFIVEDSRMISASSLKHSHDCGHTREIDDLTRTTKEQQTEREKKLGWV